MTDYTLDVDETGRFERAEPWSSVVGWLRPGLPGADDAPLRRKLREAFPAAWPLHATEANERGDGDRLRAAVRGVLGGQGLLVLARMDDAPRPDLGVVAAHPYVYALRALLARTALLFRDAPTRVHLRVADRWIGVRVGGGTARAFVHATFVHAIARAAVVGLPTKVVFLPAHARYRMDETAPAGIVIADVLANRVGHHLRRRGGPSLADLSGALEQDFGIAVAVTGRVAELPTLTADGAWDQAIRAAAAAQDGPPLRGQGWAEEQARRWIEEVAR